MKLANSLAQETRRVEIGAYQLHRQRISLFAISWPVLAGQVFDVSGSYNTAFLVFGAMWFAATVSIFGCQPLSAVESRLASVPTTA